MTTLSAVTQPSFACRIDDGIELKIKVVPGASRSEIVGQLGDRLKVRVAAPAEGGKANRAVVELLREWLSVKNIEIVAGHSSGEKTVRVSGMTEIGDAQLANLKNAPHPSPLPRGEGEDGPG